MKNDFFLILCFFSVCNLFGQIPVVYNHTPNGEAVIGNYYNYLHSEYGGISVKLESSEETYEKGEYLLIRR